MFKSKVKLKAHFSQKVLFAIISIILVLGLLQIVVWQNSAYFQTLAQCIDPNNPRADFLITSQGQSALNKFTSRIGTCIIRDEAVIGDFRQTSYAELYGIYFLQSKFDEKVILPSNAGGGC